MENKEAAEPMDVAKLKVPELRKELKSRGLSAAGNKNELMERLQMALKNKLEDALSAESVDDLDEDLLDEEEDDEQIDVAESVLNELDSPVDNATSPLGKQVKRKISDAGEDTPKVAKKIVLNRDAVSTEEKSETESIENKAPEDKDEKAEEKKVIKLSELSAKERLEMRAKKFGLPLTGEAKILARAERFGSKTTQGSHKTISISPSAPPTADVLKQRAQRFGVSVSTALTKLENQERLDKRKERFGSMANGNNDTPSTQKAQARLERFKQPVK